MSSNKAASNTSAPTLFLQANGHSYAYRPAKAHCRVLRGGESRGRRSARSILRERRRRPRRGRLVYGESRDRTVEHDGSRKISPHGCTAQRDRPRRHNRGSLPSRRRIPRQSGGTSTYLPARQRDDRIVGDSVMATATATSRCHGARASIDRTGPPGWAGATPGSSSRPSAATGTSVPSAPRVARTVSA